MVRLIGLILVFVIFLTFIILNLDNKCDISFGFTEVKDLPVFITAFASFVLGMLVTAPFVIALSRRKRSGPPSEGKPPKPKKGEKNTPPGPTAGGPEDLSGANIL
jgi:uncharacterized integral membrane protein